MALFKKPISEKSRDIIVAAETWLGYTSVSNVQTPFGKQTGYDGLVYSGTFLDVIYYSVGVSMPSFVNPGAALKESMRLKTFTQEPEIGDVIVMTFPTGLNDKFATVHVGIVADLSHWVTERQVGTIEAFVNSGLKKSDPYLHGVFRRVRSTYEIIGFIHPNYTAQASFEDAAIVNRVSFQKVVYGKRNADIGIVQDALVKAVGFRKDAATSDMFDSNTTSAYAHWQRICGYAGTDASGTPDEASLARLGKLTGEFLLSPEDAVIQ